MSQLIINLDGLSPATKAELKKAIIKELKKQAMEIQTDIKDYWGNVPNDNEAKQEMIKWKDSAYNEYMRINRNYVFNK